MAKHDLCYDINGREFTPSRRDIKQALKLQGLRASRKFEYSKFEVAVGNMEHSDVPIQ
jgi:hypothetical protein